jgi:HD superfamily phosphohydrolase
MHWLVFFLFPFALLAQKIDSFYGPIEIEEPVLIELIESPPFQRLKSIHQYGVSYYTDYPEEFTRYSHSVGVFALLRKRGAPLEEQIAGLLHDVSHTAFSHVGDWLFGKEHQDKDYQDSIHPDFLKQSGLVTILEKYGFTVDQVLPLQPLFPALECSLPDLCADRIDYNLQGAYHQSFLTHEEALEIFDDLQFVEGVWTSSKQELMKKLVRFTLFMTQDCWGGPVAHLSSRWLADSMMRAVAIGDLSHEEIHFGTDQVIWDKLVTHSDPLIQKKMAMAQSPREHFCFVEDTEADLILKVKFRGIDPWIRSEKGIARLTALDPALREEYERIRLKTSQGWAIKFKGGA